MGIWNNHRRRPDYHLTNHTKWTHRAAVDGEHPGARQTANLCGRPAGEYETKEKAKCLLTEWTAGFPPKILASTQAQGRTRDLEATVKEILVTIYSQKVAV